MADNNNNKNHNRNVNTTGANHHHPDNEAMTTGTADLPGAVLRDNEEAEREDEYEKRAGGIANRKMVAIPIQDGISTPALRE